MTFKNIHGEPGGHTTIIATIETNGRALSIEVLDMPGLTLITIFDRLTSNKSTPPRIIPLRSVARTGTTIILITPNIIAQHFVKAYLNVSVPSRGLYSGRIELNNSL